MISFNSLERFPGVDGFGTASASPQSARGESANETSLQQEINVASQANSTRFDQQVALEDRSVAARTAAVELAARLGESPALREESRPRADNAAQPFSAEGEKSPEAESPRKVEDANEANADRRNQTRRGREAYALMARSGGGSQETGSLQMMI